VSVPTTVLARAMIGAGFSFAETIIDSATRVVAFEREFRAIGTCLELA